MRKIPPIDAQRIRKKLEALEVNPYQDNNNIKRLQGSNEFRLRVGDYRAVYKIIRMELVVFVINVDTRGEV